MAAERSTVSRLFTTSVVEGRTDVDEKYDKYHTSVMNLIHGLTEKEAHDALNKTIDDQKQHEEICLGLMVAILSDSNQAYRYFQDLMMVCRDSLKGVCDALISNIVGERYHRLQETTRKQVVWLVRQLVRAGVSQAEGVVWCLLRQMAGGDVSPRNTWLADSLCDLLRENRTWLDRYSIIVASTVYSFLRVLEDHQGQQFAALRQKEVTLIVSLLRDKFTDCLLIGRDLVRLLQNVAKIPEIEAFWRDLLHNPGTLTPNFQGISQLMSTRTSRRFFVVRLTPEMEKMIVFLCSDVKFGNQKRYQEWFQRQFLNTPESQSLRCDLIRFIIGCIHPSNEVLCSDIIPRWAVIGWLLSSCTSTIATANCKLALFYDWLFFSGENDNIMNIEPGILVMYHSLKPHPMLTTSLLDFLCRIITQFHPSLITQVRAGVTNSLRQILDKRVIQNMEPLFDNSRMDHDLRRLLRDTFPEFCSVNPVLLHDEGGYHMINNSASTSSNIGKMDLMAETGLDFSSNAPSPSTVPSPTSSAAAPCPVDMELLNNHHASVVLEEDAMFSDEDDDSGGAPNNNNNNNNNNNRTNNNSGSSNSISSVNSIKISTSRSRTMLSENTAPTYSSSCPTPHATTTTTTIPHQHISAVTNTTSGSSTSSSSSASLHAPNSMLISSSSSSGGCTSISKPLSSVNTNSSNNSTSSGNSGDVSYSGNGTNIVNSSSITTSNSSINNSKTIGSNNSTASSVVTNSSYSGAVISLDSVRTTTTATRTAAAAAVATISSTIASDVLTVNGGLTLLNGGEACIGNAAVATPACLTQEQTAKLNSYLDCVEADMKDFLLQYKMEKDQTRRCELVQKVCDLILSDDLDETETDNLGGALALLFDYNKTATPEESQLPIHITQESLCETLESPIFILFENLLSLSEDDHRRHSLLRLVVVIQQHQPATGYRLLFYIKAAAKTKGESTDQLSLQVYRDLWKASNTKDMSGFIVRDLGVCSEEDPRLLCWLLPHLYQAFPKHTTGNADLVHLVLQRLDATQLHDLVCLVLQGALTMFDNSSFANILDKSLAWESVEQFFLWQLARAHEIPVDCCLSVLHRLHFTSHADSLTPVHAEALSNILMMLRRESPSEVLLKHLLQRELRVQDPTVATILQYWVQRYEDKMAKLINDIVNNKPPPSPNKRKRNQGGSKHHSHVTLDQLLSHLNHLRTECDQIKFFSLSTMQESLQVAQNQCSESQKKKYGDLFALITDSSEEKVKEEITNASSSNLPARTKQVNNKRGRKPKPRKKPESESEEESSEEEDIKKPARKRKKNSNLFASDSD